MVEIGHFSSQLFILCKVSGEEFGLRVEWSDLAIFKIFKKLHVSLIRYIFRRLNRKNRRIFNSLIKLQLDMLSRALFFVS